MQSGLLSRRAILSVTLLFSSIIGCATAAPVITATPVRPGSTAFVTWSGIPAASMYDWIALYAPGNSYTSWLSHIDYMYVSCTKTATVAMAAGSCQFPIPSTLAPGTYQLRLMERSNFGLIAATDLIVSNNPPPVTPTRVSVAPASVLVGGTITASWSGIQAPTSYDWVGLYLPGAANTEPKQLLHYVNCSRIPGSAVPSGFCTFALPKTLEANTYQLRLLSNNSYVPLATSENFTITPAPAGSCVLGDGYVIPNGGSVPTYQMSCSSDCFDLPGGLPDNPLFCLNGQLSENSAYPTSGTLGPLLDPAQYSGFGRCTVKPNSAYTFGPDRTICARRP